MRTFSKSRCSHAIKFLRSFLEKKFCERNWDENGHDWGSHHIALHIGRKSQRESGVVGGSDLLIA